MPLTTSAVSPLLGTTSVTAVNGVASFNGLSLNTAGSFSIQVNADNTPTVTVGPIGVTGPVGTGTSPVAPISAAPVVVSESLVMAGKGANRYVSGIVLTFSSALDPATAQNAANFSVIQMTRNGRTKVAKAIRVRAVYDARSNSVKLTFAGKPRFAAGGRLVVFSSPPTGIASTSGTRLEGNTGSVAGSDGIYTIVPKGRAITG